MLISPGFLYKYFRLERIDLNDSEIPDFGLLITTKRLYEIL